MKPIRYHVVEVTPTKHPVYRTTIVCRAHTPEVLERKAREAVEKWKASE